MSLEPLPSSRYLTPMRMVYSQAGRPSRAWDLMRCLSLLIVITVIIIIVIHYTTAITVIMILARCHSSVAVVIFNTDTQKFVFVQQFRPAVYVSTAASILGGWQ